MFLVLYFLFVFFYFRSMSSSGQGLLLPSCPRITPRKTWTRSYVKGKHPTWCIIVLVPTVFSSFQSPRSILLKCPWVDLEKKCSWFYCEEKPFRRHCLPLLWALFPFIFFFSPTSPRCQPSNIWEVCFPSPRAQTTRPHESKSPS